MDRIELPGLVYSSWCHSQDEEIAIVVTWTDVWMR